MVRNLILAMVLLLPGLSMCISDVHLLVDESLNVFMRRVVNEYTKKSKSVVTADFLDGKNIESTVDVVISVNNNDESAETFAKDKLHLCIHKDSTLYGSINKNGNLNTAMKLLKKHSALIVPSEKSELGTTIKKVTKKLSVTNQIEIDNIQDLIFLVVKSGAFCIIPQSVLKYYSHTQIESVMEIPKDFYEQINYNITIVSKNNIEKSRKFKAFLIANSPLLESLGFSIDT